MCATYSYEGSRREDEGERGGEGGMEGWRRTRRDVLVKLVAPESPAAAGCPFHTIVDVDDILDLAWPECHSVVDKVDTCVSTFLPQ